MSIDQASIERNAAETGFPPATVEKVVRLGELAPELLFPGDARLDDRLRAHPALLWKAENASAHRAERGGTTEETP